MRLPPFLTRLSPVGETLTAIEAGAAALAAETAVRNDCLSVSTAREEGLALWEQEYALPSGAGLSAESRRTRLWTVLLGGQTMSRPALETMAQVLGKADGAAVEEDFAAHHVTLYALYDGRSGEEDVRALQAAVERLKPAHLTVTVVPAMAVRGTLHRYHSLTGRAFLTLSGGLDT